MSETEKSGPLDFGLTSEDGKSLLMRADTLSHKTTWIRAIQRQITIQNEKRRGEVSEVIEVTPIADDTKSVPASAPVLATSNNAPATTTATVTTTASKSEPEIEPEPENADLEPETTEPGPPLETTDEMADLIRRFSLEAAGEKEDVELTMRWEEPGVEETPETAEGGRSSLIGRSSIVGYGSMVTRSSLIPTTSAAVGGGTSNGDANREGGGAPILPEVEGETTSAVFQGLEISG